MKRIYEALSEFDSWNYKDGSRNRPSNSKCEILFEISQIKEVGKRTRYKCLHDFY